ncbi:MAG: hypothetical protein HP496_12835 [Nitrospira sp.]|nr:hypothetical protein [Nitrospira sp.]
MMTTWPTEQGDRMLPVFSLLFLLWFTSHASIANATEIVILQSSELPYYEQAVLGFKAAVPPTTKIREYNLGGQLAQGRELGKSLRASPPDLILAVGLKAALTAKLEIFDQPVVFCLVLNPDAHGLPTSNMTGIAVRTPPEAQLTALRSIIPHRRRIGVLYDEEHSGSFIHDAHRAAKQQGLELVTVAIRGQEDIPQAIRELLPTIDALWLIQDQTVISESAIPAALYLFVHPGSTRRTGCTGRGCLDGGTAGRADRCVTAQAARRGTEFHSDARTPAISRQPELRRLFGPAALS